MFYRHRCTGGDTALRPVYNFSFNITVYYNYLKLFANNDFTLLYYTLAFKLFLHVKMHIVVALTLKFTTDF